MKNLKCFFTNVFESVSCFMNKEIVLGEVAGGRDKMATDDVVQNQVPPTTPAEFTTETVPTAQVAEPHPGTVQPNAAPAAEPQEPVEQQKPTQQNSDPFAEQEARKRAVQKGRSEIAANFETNK